MAENKIKILGMGKRSLHFIRLFGLVSCFALAAQAESPRFYSLDGARSESRFFAMRPGGAGQSVTDTTLRQRATTPTAQAPAAKVIKAGSNGSFFTLKRYQPVNRQTYVLKPPGLAQPASLPIQSSVGATVAATPRDNNGNRELVSNAPYSSLFYGAPQVGEVPHGWPVDVLSQQRISSGFGMRNHPTTGRDAFHKGVDIAAATGTPVLASADGVVEESSRDGLLGNFVKLRHPDGSQSLYGHLSASAVKEGQWLQRGQRLGSVGSTGRTTGPHLHFALNVNDKAINPMEYLRRPGQQVALR